MSEANRRTRIRLTRDSVCAGDDGDAPHESEVEVACASDPVAFAQALAEGYLPSVAGVGHAWICRLNGVDIAELALAGTKALVREVPFSDKNQAHFIYLPASF